MSERKTLESLNIVTKVCIGLHKMPTVNKEKKTIGLANGIQTNRNFGLNNCLAIFWGIIA